MDKCLQHGYSISTPIGGGDDVAFVAYAPDKVYKAIMFMNYIGTDIGEWEKYYRTSYPHIRYYQRKLP